MTCSRLAFTRIIVFPAEYSYSIDMKHLGKDFLGDAKLLPEITDVSWRSADVWLQGEIYARIAQLSLNHADTLLQIG